jgi:RHS repeat-associated protein
MSKIYAILLLLFAPIFFAQPVPRTTTLYQADDAWQNTQQHWMGRKAEQTTTFEGGRYFIKTQLIDATSGLNAVSTREIDSQTQLLKAYTDSSGERYTFDYADFGRIVTLQHGASGFTQTHTYLPLNLLKRIETRGMITFQADWDVYRRPLEILDHGRRYAFRYDRQGLLSEIEVDFRKIEILKTEPTGRPTHVRFSNQIELQLAYFEDLRTLKHAELKRPGGMATRMSYDEFGNLGALKDPYGSCLRFGYNSWGFPAVMKVGDGPLLHLYDDAAPDLLQLPGGVVIEVDGVGAEYRRSFPGTAELTFHRNGEGRLDRVTANGYLAIERSFNGPRLLEESAFQSSSGPPVQRTYHYEGNHRSRIDHNLDGPQVFGWDENFSQILSSYTEQDFSYNYKINLLGRVEELKISDLTSAFYFDQFDGQPERTSFLDVVLEFQDWQYRYPQHYTSRHAGFRSDRNLHFNADGTLAGYTATNNQNSDRIDFDIYYQSLPTCLEGENEAVPRIAIKRVPNYFEATATDIRADKTLAAALMVRAAGDLRSLNDSRSAVDVLDIADQQLYRQVRGLTDGETNLSLDLDFDQLPDLTAQLTVHTHANPPPRVSPDQATQPGVDQLLIQVIHEDYGQGQQTLIRQKLQRTLYQVTLTRDAPSGDYRGRLDIFTLASLIATSDGFAEHNRQSSLSIGGTANKTATNVALTYDDFGNAEQVLSASGVAPLIFDGSRRLRQIGIHQYHYDAFHRRTRSSDSGLPNNLRYAYLGSKPIAIGFEKAGKIQWEYTIVQGPLGAEVIYDLSHLESFIVHNDHMGTPWAFQSTATGKIYHQSSAPWGDLNHNLDSQHPLRDVAVPHAVSVTLPDVATTKRASADWRLFETPNFRNLHLFLGLSGHIRDRNHLIYMHHRTYSPLLGHFLTPDFRAPNIYDPRTFSEPYAYAAGNPFMYWDPDGLQVRALSYYDSGNLEIQIDASDWQEYKSGTITRDVLAERIYKAIWEAYDLQDRGYFVNNFKAEVIALITQGVQQNVYSSEITGGYIMDLPHIEHLTQAAEAMVPPRWRVPLLGYRFGPKSSLHPPYTHYIQQYFDEINHLNQPNQGYPQFRHLSQASSMLLQETTNIGGELAADQALTKLLGVAGAGIPHLLRSNKPIRLALGRWENVDSFWKNLVVDKQLHHLQFKDTPWSTPAIDALALGDEVFVGNSMYPDLIVSRTKDFLLHSNISEIYFDLNRMNTASRVQTLPTSGYFAREELKIIIENESLFKKTKFIRMGVEVKPSIEYLKRLIRYD